MTCCDHEHEMILPLIHSFWQLLYILPINKSDELYHAAITYQPIRLLKTLAYVFNKLPHTQAKRFFIGIGTCSI